MGAIINTEEISASQVNSQPAWSDYLELCKPRVVALMLKPKFNSFDDINFETKVDLPAPEGAEKIMALPSPLGNLPAGISLSD